MSGRIEPRSESKGNEDSIVTVIELGSLGEFIGAIGVVITLVYLALQIRHNTRAVRSSMHQDMIESTLRIAESLSDNGELVLIVIKAEANYDDLTTEEHYRFEAYAERVFGNFESVYYSYRNSMIEEDLWESWESSFLTDISRDAMRRFWQDERPQHLRDFMDFVDQFYRTHPTNAAAKGS